MTPELPPLDLGELCSPTDLDDWSLEWALTVVTAVAAALRRPPMRPPLGAQLAPRHQIPAHKPWGAA
ncbi:MAG: hypothetical protein ACREQ5_34670 [Candidatus Dormibacteria bacterium]